MANQIVEIKLPDDSTVLARVSPVGSLGATKVGVVPKFDFEGVGKSLRGLAGAIQAALEDAAPDRTTVEFGIEIAAQSAGLSGLVVEGGGRGSLVVTLEWEKKT